MSVDNNTPIQLTSNDGYVSTINENLLPTGTTTFWVTMKTSTPTAAATSKLTITDTAGTFQGHQQTHTLM